MVLSQAPKSEWVRIRGVRGECAVSCRLMELGFVEGTECCVLGCAPLGDPIQVRIGCCDMSLRREQADLIEYAAASCLQ